MNLKKGVRKFNELEAAVGRRNVVFFFAIAFYCALTMYYADITVTGQYGLVFLDSLFDGRAFSFYDNALASGIAPEGAVYDIGTYIIFGIWSLPVWILRKITGVSPLSVGSLLWFKLLVILFYLGTVRLVYQIGRKIFPDVSDVTAVQMAFLYAISLYTFFPVFVAVQYDVISVFFLLWGIECYFSDSNKWIWLAGISMTIKPMTVLVLLLLVVRRYKSIPEIIFRMIQGMLLLLVCKGLYWRDPGYQQSAVTFLSKGSKTLFQYGFETPLGTVSLFILFLAIFYAIAYFMKDQDNRFTVILILCIWLSFQIFGGMTCYWSVYIAPFLALTIFMIPEGTRNRILLLDLAAEIGITILYTLRYTWVYGGENTYGYLILKALLQSREQGGNSPATAAGFLRRLNIQSYSSAILAVVVACYVVIVYIAVKNAILECRNREKVTVAWEKPKDENANAKVVANQAQTAIKTYNWNWLFRILVIAGFAGYTLAALLVTR